MVGLEMPFMKVYIDMSIKTTLNEGIVPVYIWTDNAEEQAIQLKISIQ